MRRWQRRYFWLFKGHLVYFRSKEDCTYDLHTATPKGSIDMRSFLSYEVIDDRNFEFKITGSHFGMYILRAKHKAALLLWKRGFENYFAAQQNAGDETKAASPTYDETRDEYL